MGFGVALGVGLAGAAALGVGRGEEALLGVSRGAGVDVGGAVDRGDGVATGSAGRGVGCDADAAPGVGDRPSILSLWRVDP